MDRQLITVNGNTTTAAADMRVFYNALHTTYSAVKNSGGDTPKKIVKKNPIVLEILGAAAGPMSKASSEGKCQIPIAKFRTGHMVDGHTLDLSAQLEIARTMAPVKIFVEKDSDYIWLIADWSAPPEVILEPEIVQPGAVETLVNPK